MTLFYYGSSGDLNTERIRLGDGFSLTEEERSNWVPLAIKDELENMHELEFVDDGTRALYFYDKTINVTAEQSEAIGFTEWNCPIRENGIRERDLKTDRILFQWDSSDHIDLTESTFVELSVEERCTYLKKVSQCTEF